MMGLLLSDYTFRLVALGTACIGMVCGVLGCFVVSRRQSLIGDVVSHSVLPGVVLAFLLTGSKSTPVLLLGAAVSGVLASVLVNLIKRHTRMNFESILATVLATFFGLGIFLMTVANKLPGANKAGISGFIYGRVSSMMIGDVFAIIVVSAAVLTVTMLFWKEFVVISFDAEFARVIGIPNRRVSYLLSALIVTSIIIGLQTVGVVLISSLLVAPAVAAAQWTHRLGKMCMLSAVFGAVSGLLGTVVSSLVPKMPTGPCIVVIVSFIAFLSLLASPRGGLARALRNKRLKTEVRRKGGAADAGEDTAAGS